MSSPLAVCAWPGARSAPPASLRRHFAPFLLKFKKTTKKGQFGTAGVLSSGVSVWEVSPPRGCSGCPRKGGSKVDFRLPSRFSLRRCPAGWHKLRSNLIAHAHYGRHLRPCVAILRTSLETEPPSACAVDHTSRIACCQSRVLCACPSYVGSSLPVLFPLPTCVPVAGLARSYACCCCAEASSGTRAPAIPAEGSWPRLRLQSWPL